MKLSISHTLLFSIGLVVVLVPTCWASETSEDEKQSKGYYAVPDGGKCYKDSQCESHNCDYGFCRPLLRHRGEPCGADEQCISGGCGLIFHPGVYQGGNYRVCCRTNTKTTFQSRSYCAGELSDGHPCAEDAMCRSDFCDPHVKACRSVREAGEKCKKDFDCRDGACAKFYKTGGSYICCPSGDKVGYKHGYYCTGTPNDEPCGLDAMCNSGYCNYKRVCGPPPSGPGGRCEDDRGCLNRACGSNYPTTNKICCESGDTTRYNGVEYCTGRPNGSACATSRMCDSYKCHYEDDQGSCLSRPSRPYYDKKDKKGGD